MSDRARRRLAWGVCIATVAFAIGTIPLAWAGRHVTPVGMVGSVAIVIALVWAAVGARIASVAHGNAVGWLFLNVGLGIALTLFCQSYIVYALRVNPGVPGVGVAAVAGEYGLTPSVGPLALLFALFPDGRLPSRGWRWVVWTILGGLALALVAFVVKPETLNNYRELGIEYPNPTGVEALAGVAPVAILIGALTAIAGSIGAIFSLRYRSRRSSGEVRQQIRWLAFVGVVALVLFIAFFFLGAFEEAVRGDRRGFPFADVILAALALTIGFGVPVATVIAVLKHRLYDIDVVLNKTLVYGSLAAFITAVYVGVVVGIGSAFGRGDEPNLGLSIVATAVVAVAFQPVRSMVQHLANRLVYGQRATPYEVLSEFSHRMAGTYASEDVLPRMARILAEGTGAKEARVWLRVSGRLTPVATWPHTNGDGHATRSDADLLVPVTHQGEDLGALSIVKSAGDKVTPAEDKLTRDLASQAGLVLRNVRLIEDLKASRVRLVQAQDAERRRIERNIHDGAQQQLVALGVKLGLARRLTSDPERLQATLTQLQGETDQALQDLRDLARGIYPPLLADRGLAAALQAQARKSPVPVTVEANGVGRYTQEVEAAVYFCVLEALQNVAKYAGATTVVVRLSGTDAVLSFEVTDDGEGFDPATTPRGAGLTNMTDRLAALGGEVEIRSRPGTGTTVIGRVPVRAPERSE